MIFACRHFLHVGHLPVGRRFDHFEVTLEKFDAQQPIVVRWLILGRDAEPDVIGIESVAHRLIKSELFCRGHFSLTFFNVFVFAVPPKTFLLQSVVELVDLALDFVVSVPYLRVT